MKSLRTFAVLAFLLAASARLGRAQCDNCSLPPDAAANILGVHNSGGRGCALCHTPHNASSDLDSEPAATSVTTSDAPLWGQSARPDYGSQVLFGDPKNYVEFPPDFLTSPDDEVIGVLLCLSCHDGNLTPQNMMPGQSYARKLGFLGVPGRQPVPSFLVNETAMDHPLGTDAVIPLVEGLAFSNRVFTVAPGTVYARFVANYGLPVLAPGKRSVPYGVNREGQPYVLCTTCHNEHLMSVYPSTAESPISGDGGGRFYTALFFANGPYSQKFDTAVSNRAPSSAQFCRQCHINVANEGNNTLNVWTVFP